MFGSSRNKSHGFLHSSRVHKSSTKKQPSFRSKERSFTQADLAVHKSPPFSPPSLHSAIVTISVGPTQRLFAAHEEILCRSPWFADVLRRQFYTHTPNSPTNAGGNAKRIELPDQEAEVFSTVLEYLYKGDYFPRLEYDKRRNVWMLENGGAAEKEITVLHNGAGEVVLKDTIIYCTADLYGLPELERLALKKQGLQQGIQCSTILASARFAYENTPDTDSRLRAHYLALIIRSRDVFKRSGTMQLEMGKGGKMWFDLFVALVNHLDDIAGVRSPR